MHLTFRVKVKVMKFDCKYTVNLSSYSKYYFTIEESQLNWLSIGIYI